VGLLFRAWRAGEPPPPATPPAGALAGADDPRVPKDYLTQNLIGQYHYMLGFTALDRDWLTARRELAAAAAAAPDNDVLFYNLGLVYRRYGLLDDALAAFERSHEINPRHIASHSRPEARDRIEELRAERARLAGIEGDIVAADPVLRRSAPGTAAFHRRMAELLETRGEELAATGHRLRAVERDGGWSGSGAPVP
jgi:tetratricopeptide (TPR) repeat protein